jgi:TPR repeat protein
MMLEARGGGGSAEAAVSWFQAGAGMGSVSAMYNLARCCHQGLGMPEDWSQARALYLLVSAGAAGGGCWASQERLRLAGFRCEPCGALQPALAVAWRGGATDCEQRGCRRGTGRFLVGCSLL